MLRLQSALGIFALLLIAWVLSENRRAVSARQAAIGLVVTFVAAIVLLKLPVVAPPSPRHCEELLRRSNPEISPRTQPGLLRGACHRAALRADPLARNDDC